MTNKNSCCVCNTTPLVTKSRPCPPLANNLLIEDHPCSDHCYNFECNYDDSCGNVDGTAIGSGVSFKSTTGVPNLGTYLFLSAPVGSPGEKKWLSIILM